MSNYFTLQYRMRRYFQPFPNFGEEGRLAYSSQCESKVPSSNNHEILLLMVIWIVSPIPWSNIEHFYHRWNVVKLILARSKWLHIGNRRKIKIIYLTNADTRTTCNISPRLASLKLANLEFEVDLYSALPDFLKESLPPSFSFYRLQRYSFYNLSAQIHKLEHYRKVKC